MSTITGERDCAGCGQRVLMVRNIETGQLVALEPQRTDGGWQPRVDHSMLVAAYRPPANERTRDGHHAHQLRCPATRASQHALERSRQRIAAATTEGNQ